MGSVGGCCEDEHSPFPQGKKKRDTVKNTTKTWNYRKEKGG
jgi:hypothetical protein